MVIVIMCGGVHPPKVTNQYGTSYLSFMHREEEGEG